MTPNIFTQIQELIPTLHGWCDENKATHLAALVLALKPDTVVEIGVWGGRSLFPIAIALKENNKGVVIGIDPWQAAASVEGQGKADADWWNNDPQHEMVFKDYVSHIEKLGLQSQIVTHRARSDDVTPPPIIDVLHLDGNHSEQANRDAQKYATKVRVGGFCCLDDLRWSGGGVERAEAFILSIGFVKLYDLGTGAMYQRMGAL